MAGAALDLIRSPPPVEVSPADLTPAATALERAGAEVALVHVDARSHPWTPTGLMCRQGEPITWLAHGETWVVTRRGVHFDAGWQLRLIAGGAGPVLEGTGPTFTAPAPQDGAIEMCCLYPGEIGSGTNIVYDPMFPRTFLRGAFDVVVAVWPNGTDVCDRLTEAAMQDPTGLCDAERCRLRVPATPPPGWAPHRHIPLRGIHRRRDDQIVVDCRGQVEIICREARVRLTDGLRLRWRWKLDAIPAARSEDTLLTHDYMAVAVEFDDGRDLAYHWSVALPKESSYRCPYPHWRHREWHLAVRSGVTGLGFWQEEERALAPDRSQAIGGAAPSEVVRVWLIASCVSAGVAARGRYADIELVDGNATILVL